MAKQHHGKLNVLAQLHLIIFVRAKLLFDSGADWVANDLQ